MTDSTASSTQDAEKTALPLDDAAAPATAADAPATADALPAFDELGLSDNVLAAVADLGDETPSPVQARAIPEVLAGHDLLAAA